MPQDTCFVDFEKNGCVLIDRDRDRVRSEWYHLKTVRNPDSLEMLAAVVEAAKVPASSHTSRTTRALPASARH